MTHSILTPKQFGPLVCSAYTHIGKRGNQEDRLVMAPSMLGGEYSFFGVFDGTVKEHASEFVHKVMVDCVLTSKAFRTFHALSNDAKADPKNNKFLKECMTEAYATADARLLQWCREVENHYSSSTSVTVLIHMPTLQMVVGHIGDSKIILGKVVATEEKGQTKHQLVGMSLTTDHKPDMVDERKRIEACGGSLTYLHGGKPFIRGGDFSQRKHAMQLNYSRAFGGKDLKMYGLSSVPDVNLHQLKPGRDRMVIVGSDGIWDVMDAETAVSIAEQAQRQQVSPSEELGRLALRNHVASGSADNVTAITIFFDWPQ